MSFFAIAANNDQDFKIVGCHFNLWCLPHDWWSPKAYFCSPFMFCDIGLRLVTKSDGMDGIQLLLPFGTSADGFYDLSELVLEESTARLIFGREVTFLAGQRIRYDGSSIHEAVVEEEVLTIPATNAQLVTKLTGNEFSVWKIKFRRALSVDERVYLRVRFKIAQPGDAWASRGWGYAKRGALVDIRICDIRESVEIPAWNALKPLIKPIEKLNLFLIVAAQQFARLYSPRFYYLRLMEHSVWERYIEFGHGRKPRGKLSIYQWRGPVSTTGSSNISGGTGAIGTEKPFRLFVDLYQDFGPQLFIAYALGLFTPAVVSILVKYLAK